MTMVAPGDRVVIAWRAPCGECPQCSRGDPRRCSSQLRAKRRMRRAVDGALLTPVLRCGTFAEQAVVHEAVAIKVPEELPIEQATLLACGFSTGAGAALWATPVREDSTVAVIGCGGVGLAVIQGALLRNAGQIVAVDVAPEKLGHARALGATDVVDASSTRSRRGGTRAHRRARRRVRLLRRRRRAGARAGRADVRLRGLGDDRRPPARRARSSSSTSTPSSSGRGSRSR